MQLEWLALLMFVFFFALIMVGYPVGYSFAATGVLFAAIGFGFGIFNQSLLLLLPNRWFGTMLDDQLLAIPFFIFMGSIFEKSGLAEELLDTMGVILGPLRGGLTLAVVVVGTLLAATTGVVAATVIMMGMISLPSMLRYGYDKQLATGVITASGTLAQMIPPSLVLVVLSDQIGVSVGDLFLGALIPGLMLSAAYAIYALVIAWLKPDVAPAMPREIRDKALQDPNFGWRIIRSIVVPALLVFVVLGSIFFGIASPTEAGSVGAVGATLLALLNKRLSWKVIRDVGNVTMRITSLVLTILFCSSFFSVVFDGLGGQRYITNLLTGMPGGFWTFMIVANIVIFLLGINLEFIEICFIAMPLLVPAANLILPSNPEFFGGQQNVQYAMVWFGIVMAVNLQTAFISPPVGFSLFYLQSVAPKEVSTLDIHKGALPFVALQVLVLILVMLFPQTVIWLVSIASH